MEEYMITFRSVTPAQRGEALLRQAGYLCRLQRTPKWMENQGCGYSLRLRGQGAAEGARLLRERKIPFRKLYRVGETGSPEEITL
ncbi:MAG: DUF3343 domain-containing protein [Oscillospiraceae bacterium]|nr:DUF3343 domain-containing protein [Oscillospiraceae bacterium]